VIVVDGLTKRYGRTPVVDGVSFEVGRGETFGILGRVGAGKTTSVDCVCGASHKNKAPDDHAARVVAVAQQRCGLAPTPCTPQRRCDAGHNRGWFRP
jgi:ABC-type uncharacterized transport system ATPase subunit